MAWLDWPRPPWFYDRSTLSERIVGHPLPVSTPSACWLQDSDLFPNVGVFVVRGKYRITVYVSVKVCNWTDDIGWRKCQFPISFRQGYVVAPELLLEPMNWIMSCAAHKGFLGLTVGEETRMDLDHADDVSLLASILEIFVSTEMKCCHIAVRFLSNFPISFCVVISFAKVWRVIVACFVFILFPVLFTSFL